MSKLKYKAKITIDVRSLKFADTIFKALKPETNVVNNKRHKIQIDCKEEVLTLIFEAISISKLRALINSYLRWVITTRNTIEVIVKAKNKNVY